MSKSGQYFELITRMHMRLNSLIAENKLNLQSDVVLKYSKRLDRVLNKYHNSKLEENQKDSLTLPTDEKL